MKKIVFTVVLAVAVFAVALLAQGPCSTQKIVGHVVQYSFSTRNSNRCYASNRMISAGSPIYSGNQVTCDGQCSGSSCDTAWVVIQSTGQASDTVYVSYTTNNGWVAPCDTNAGLQQE